MKRSPFATQGEALARRVRGLTLAIAIIPASLTGSALAIDLNQHGLTGAWYNPAVDGQGIGLEVYQDAIAPGIGYLHGGWATFAGGYYSSGHRWYTFGGIVVRGETSATFTIFRNDGGNFNAPPATVARKVGTMVLTVHDCTTAVMEYRLAMPDDFFDSGTIPLVRATPDITCSLGGASAPEVDFAYSGHWFDPATSGQGFFVELNRIAEVAFVIWYTYTGLPYGNVWFTGQGKLVPGARALPMSLYQTDGGSFNDPGPNWTAKTQMVGTATLTLFDCDTAQLTFKFSGGGPAGLSGTINLSRVGPTPRDCGP